MAAVAAITRWLDRPHFSSGKTEMLIKAYSDFSLSTYGPFIREGIEPDLFIYAHFRLDADVSPLFLYINAMVPAAVFLGKPPFIRFRLDGFLCGLYPDHGVAALFEDRN